MNAAERLQGAKFSLLGGYAVLAVFLISSPFFVGRVSALDNGLALTPPLGWSSWVALGDLDFCDEKSLMESADAIVSNGMAAAGYTTMVISDCWGALDRDKNGNLQANTTRFPSGTLKPVIDYIHSKGLKAGVYQDIGTGTCNKHLAGMYGHYEQDAQLLANEWHIDWIKVDNCNNKEDPRKLYPQLAKAFNDTGRPVLINLCEWGLDSPWEGWAGECGNTWRVTADHQDNFNRTKDIISRQAGMSNYSGHPRYGWNDMDMVFTGLAGQRPKTSRWPGQSETEYITEFSMWALLQSPIVVSADIRNITDFQRRVLFNQDVLAVHNDTGTPQGDLLAKVGDPDVQIWGKKLSDGGWAVVLLNLSDKTAVNQLSFVFIGWNKNTTAHVKNLWTGEETDSQAVWPVNALKQEPHSCVMIVLHRTN